MKGKTIHSVVLAFLCSLCFSSCFLLGIKDPKKIPFRASEKFIVKKLDTARCRVVEIKNIAFHQALVSLSDKNNGTSLFIQPLQFYMFENGRLVSMGANCTYPAKTLLTLNWDHYRQFSQDSAYIPLRADTSRLYQNRFGPYLDSLAGLNPAQNTVVVFASKCLKKTCRDYLKYMNRYKKTHPQTRFVIVPFDHVVARTLQW